MNTRNKLTVIALLFAFGPVLWACVNIANDWLLSGETEFLRTPRAIFRSELIRLSDQYSSEFRSVPATNGYFNQTLETELSDLKRSLQSSGISPLEIQELLSRHAQARNNLNDLSERVGVWRTAGNTGSIAVDLLPQAPDGLPSEFAAYFDGCVQFHLGNTNGARHAWYGLLDLPRANRLWRSSWAAFMLGKLDLDVDPQTAIKWLQEVRQLVSNGFEDSLGLASASYGWEARAQLNLNNPAAAIELYLDQQATGVLDFSSLRTAARAVLELPPERLIEVAGNPRARAVVSSYLLSRSWNPDNWYLAEDRKLWVKWLNAAAAATAPDLQAAEQFAWISYQCGQFETAKQWLPFTDPGSPGVLWLSAKLKLRDGDLDGAAQDLSVATRLTPIVEANPADNLFSRLTTSSHHGPNRIRRENGGVNFSKSGRDRIHGEHGVLQFERQNYLQALNTFLSAGYWLDAAYVADRILTLDELQSYVDQFWPAASREEGMDEDNPLEWRARTNRERIRYLLARRLSRNHRESDAREYYPDQWLPKLDQLLTAFRDGHRPSASRREQAAALLEAARLTRQHGLELYGTATEPDWQVYRGNFTYFGPSLDIRQELPADDPLSPNTDEQERHLQSGPTPEERFHYRYVAAGLAWKAAELMPDQDDQTAAILCEAGGWVKYSNPQFADKFYKALVIRCGFTELGTAADRKRWFPRITADGQLNEPMPPPVKTTYSGPWEGDASR